MISKIKRITALLLTLLLMFSLFGCGNKKGEESVDDKNDDNEPGLSAGADDVFTINCNPKFSMNPLLATNTSNQLVCSFVYENIIDVDNTFTAVPSVASDWSTEDGGQTWSLTIAPGHKFHDGANVTASDVAYSIQCAIGSDRFGKRLTNVYSAEAIGGDTVQVSLNSKNGQLPLFLSIPVIEYGTYTNAYPGGSGPYTYANDYKSLVAFEDYYIKDAQPIDTIYLAEYNSVEEIIPAFEDALLDMVINDPTATTNLGYGSSNEIRGFNTTNMHYIGLNTHSSVFRFDSLRYIMNYAFDREYLVKDQLNNYAELAVLPINPISPYYSKSIAKQYEYNLTTCEVALGNAGLLDFDNDGFVEMKTDNVLAEIEIDFIVCNASSIKVNMARKFADDMESIGLKVNVRPLSWDDYTAALTMGDFDIYYGEVRLTPDFDLTRLLMDGGSLNYGGVSSASLNELINAYLAADDKGRKDACAAMCNEIAANAYIVPLCFEKHQMITHRNVVSGITATENNPCFNIANWEINRN